MYRVGQVAVIEGCDKPAYLLCCHGHSQALHFFRVRVKVRVPPKFLHLILYISYPVPWPLSIPVRSMSTESGKGTYDPLVQEFLYHPYPLPLPIPSFRKGEAWLCSCALCFAWSTHANGSGSTEPIKWCWLVLCHAKNVLCSHTMYTLRHTKMQRKWYLNDRERLVF